MILEGETPNYFEMDMEGSTFPARFMLVVQPIHADKGDQIQAVNHLGTGRLQTVRREWNPRYYDVIDQFGQASSVPVLLNTSFNLRGEPIVTTPQNAWNTFCNSEIDTLVLENYLIRK